MGVTSRTRPPARRKAVRDRVGSRIVVRPVIEVADVCLAEQFAQSLVLMGLGDGDQQGPAFLEQVAELGEVDPGLASAEVELEGDRGADVGQCPGSMPAALRPWPPGGPRRCNRQPCPPERHLVIGPPGQPQQERAGHRGTARQPAIAQPPSQAGDLPSRQQGARRPQRQQQVRTVVGRQREKGQADRDPADQEPLEPPLVTRDSGLTGSWPGSRATARQRPRNVKILKGRKRLNR
jgi:hypothetical protein